MDAIVLAAGEGTRLRPLTVTRPKPMLPVAGRPILEWNLRALREAGVKKAVLVVGYRRDVIESYFGSSYDGLALDYIIQEEQLGTGHAILQAKDKVSGPFIVMNGDLVVSGKTLTDFLAAHKSSRSKTGMAVTAVDDPSHYGIVVVEKDRVKKLVEKPDSTTYGTLANAGIYVFDDALFPLLEDLKKSRRHEYEVTSAIEKQLTGDGVYAFSVSDMWIDIGRPWDLLVANETIMQSNAVSFERSADADVEDYVVLKGRVGIGKDSVIRSGAYIEGPVLIGEGCTVGPNCYLRAHTVLEDDTYVGNGVEVKNSIIMAGTHIGHLSYVGDSVIGERCNFGAGTKVANLKFDDSAVNVDVKGEIVSSGRRKMGTIMGDDVKTGINVSILPGRSIYPGASVAAGSIVQNTIYKEPVGE